jgi:hypothetical protein
LGFGSPLEQIQGKLILYSPPYIQKSYYLSNLRFRHIFHGSPDKPFPIKLNKRKKLPEILAIYR